ncbi:MAG: zinc-ribbon domain-containing protein [Candidatus Hadarchaeum sp.]
MASCKSCGADLPDDARYCPRCGKPAARISEEFSISSEDLVKKVKELVHEGNITG